MIIEILNHAIDDLRKRTKLTLTDIHQLIELCLSTDYFIFHTRVRILENSGPIGLALIIIIIIIIISLFYVDKTLKFCN